MTDTDVPENVIVQARQVACGVFFFFFTVYLLSYSGRIHSVDEAYMLALTESFAKDRLDVNQVASMQWGFNPLYQVGTFGPSGDVFCKKGVGISLFALPLLWTSSAFPKAGSVHSSLLTNIIITSLTGILLFRYLLTLGFSLRASMACSLTFGIGTVAWPYARFFFAEPLAAFGMLLALYGCTLFHRTRHLHSAFLCGLGLGVTVLAFSAGVIASPIFLGGITGSVIFKRRSRQIKSHVVLAVTGWVLGLLGPLFITFLYNYLRFGSPWETGWRAEQAISVQDFTLPIHKGLIGLLISPARGLLFYSPVLLLALFGYVKAFRKHKYEFSLITALVAIYLIFYSMWRAWHAGWSWGPRYLVPILPLMCIPMAATWEHVNRRQFILGRAMVLLLVTISVTIQLIGVAGNYTDAEYALSDEFGLRESERFDLGRKVFFDVTKSPLVLQTQNITSERLDWSWFVGGQIDHFALGMSLLALLTSALTLWFAYISFSKFRIIAYSTGFLVFISTLVVVTHATSHPFYDIEPDGRLEVLSHVVSNQEPGDALISTVPYLYELMMDRYPSLPPVYGLPRDQRNYPETIRLLEKATERHSRLWFLSVWALSPDPNNHTELWLTKNAFLLAKWDFGGYRLILFSAPPLEPEVSGPVGVTFADSFRLEQFTVSHEQRDSLVILQLTLKWRSLQLSDKDYQIFVHVYNHQGDLITQADHSPVGGFYPTSVWSPGELVQDQVALELPPGWDIGDYCLAVGLYDWVTAERVIAFSESEGLILSEDRVFLTRCDMVQ